MLTRPEGKGKDIRIQGNKGNRVSMLSGENPKWLWIIAMDQIYDTGTPIQVDVRL